MALASNGLVLARGFPDAVQTVYVRVGQFVVSRHPPPCSLTDYFGES